MLKTLKYSLIRWLAGELLPVVDEKNLIQFSTANGQTKVFIGKKIATTQELRNLQEEARFLKESRLWEIIHSYFHQLAMQKMVMECKDIPDLLFGKTVLYTHDVEEKIVDNLLKLKI